VAKPRLTTLPSPPQAPEEFALLNSGDALVRSQRSFLHVSLRFAVLSAAAYSLSLARAVVVARYFGTTRGMDAFAIAILIPNLIGALIAGSCASALIPALALAEMQGVEERGRTVRSYLVLVTGVCVLLCALLALCANPLTAVLASRFDTASRALAASLMRWSSPLLFLNAIYAVGSAELLSRKKYNLLALAPAVSSLASLGIILLLKNSGAPVLVCSFVIGAALQALLVGWPAWSANPICGPTPLWTPVLGNLVRNQIPLLIASVVGVANVSVDQAIAGFLPAGNVSALNYASSINALVVQLVVMSAAVVALPELAELAARGKMEILLARARGCIAGTTMVAAPVAALILVCGGFLIRVLLQHGAFDEVSTRLVFATWIGYTVGLVPFSIGIMAARLISVTNVNYALVALGVVALPLNGLLDYLLMQKWGCLGISLSTSLVYCVTSTVMYAFLRDRLGNVVSRPTWSVILRSVLVSTVAGGCLWTIRAMVPNQWLGVVLGTLVFAIVLFLGYVAVGLLGTTSHGVVFLPAWGIPSEMKSWRTARTEQ